MQFKNKVDIRLDSNTMKFYKNDVLLRTIRFTGNRVIYTFVEDIIITHYDKSNNPVYTIYDCGFIDIIKEYDQQR